MAATREARPVGRLVIGAACIAGYIVVPPLGLIATAGALYGLLLRLAGLRPVVAVPVAGLHVLLLLALAPISPPHAGVGVFASGACTYAILVVDRLWLRCTAVAVAHAGLIAAFASAP